MSWIVVMVVNFFTIVDSVHSCFNDVNFFVFEIQVKISNNGSILNWPVCGKSYYNTANNIDKNR